MKKNRIEPSFALAMAIKENDEAPFLSIELAQWQKYVAGETITVPGNEGWVVLKVAEVPIGFGKQVQGVVKTSSRKDCGSLWNKRNSIFI